MESVYAGVKGREKADEVVTKARALREAAVIRRKGRRDDEGRSTEPLENTTPNVLWSFSGAALRA